MSKQTMWERIRNRHRRLGHHKKGPIRLGRYLRRPKGGALPKRPTAIMHKELRKPQFKMPKIPTFKQPKFNRPTFKPIRRFSR